MIRLPLQEGNAKGLGACFVGVPMDISCSYRSGARFGPAAIRRESCALRAISATGIMIYTGC